MKKLLLFTTACALMSLTTHAQWANLNVNMTYDGFINDIEAVDANIVWGNPYILNGTANDPTADFVRTTDGGATWNMGTVNGIAGHKIANIWPIDANTCYVSMYNPTGAGGEIYKTTNGGATWAQASTASMFAQTTSFADVVYFWDAANGMAMGDPAGPGTAKYEIWLTADSGSTWTRVPAANIPSLANANEYGITNLFANADGRIWFGTTYGDVYRSIDGGSTWTKSATGLPANNTTNGRFDITDIAFSDSLNGIVLQVATAGNTWKSTTDGGLTWTTVVPSGNAYISDIDGVPGTNIFVSAGSSTAGGFGTSFSTDGGLTWTDLDINLSHTAIDFVNNTTGFTGEFITAGPVGGAWSFNGTFTQVTCGSPAVSPGVASVNDTLICFNDTLFFTTANAVVPGASASAGFAVVITTNDISGSHDPLNVSGGPILGAVFPYSNPFTVFLTNDGSILTPGYYYFTSVIFGNASGSGQDLSAYVLDTACTNSGTSVLVHVVAQGDPLCTVGISENHTTPLAVFANIKDNNIDLQINSSSHEKAVVSVYDVTGRMVYTGSFYIAKGVNHENINVQNFTTGAYIIKVEAGNAKAVNKLVKF